MGRKIINGIEVNTNLKRRRVEIKQGCQSSIIGSSPTHYWQFENIENGDVVSVTSPQTMRSSSTTYAYVVKGVEETNGIQGFPNDKFEYPDPELIELVYEVNNADTGIEDISPVCPIASPHFTVSGTSQTFYEVFQEPQTYPSDMDFSTSLLAYNSFFNGRLEP